MTSYHLRHVPSEGRGHIGDWIPPGPHALGAIHGYCGAFSAGVHLIGLNVNLPFKQEPDPPIAPGPAFDLNRLIRSFTKFPGPHGLWHAALALVLYSVDIVPAVAQMVSPEASGIRDCRADEVIKFRGGTVRLENDLFTGTDQNYTNGVAFTLVSHDIAGKLQPECLPTPVRLHVELIKFMNPDFWSDPENSAHTQNIVVKFGQSMFTPKDFAGTDLILNDRPYAGLLYIGLSWNRRKHEPQTNLEMLDTREITLGVIGSWSLAEQSQNVVHDAIGADRFPGWDHQLKNEPAVQLSLRSRARIRLTARLP